MPTTTDVVTAITAHHQELQSTLTERVHAVLAAARTGTPHRQAAAHLRQLLATEIVPHARAEEEVLYAAATDDTLVRLVTGMTFEHKTLLGLTSELDTTTSATDAAGVARAIREIFVGHVRRENELLLPALAADSTVDLVSLLPAMEERFTAYRAAAGHLEGGRQ